MSDHPDGPCAIRDCKGPEHRAGRAPIRRDQPDPANENRTVIQ